MQYITLILIGRLKLVFHYPCDFMMHSCYRKFTLSRTLPSTGPLRGTMLLPQMFTRHTPGCSTWHFVSLLLIVSVSISVNIKTVDQIAQIFFSNKMVRSSVGKYKMWGWSIRLIIIASN